MTKHVPSLAVALSLAVAAMTAAGLALAGVHAAAGVEAHRIEDVEKLIEEADVRPVGVIVTLTFGLTRDEAQQRLAEALGPERAQDLEPIDWTPPRFAGRLSAAEIKTLAAAEFVSEIEPDDRRETY